MRLRSLAVALGLLAFGNSIEAAGILLASSNDGTLFSVNLSTGAGTAVGSLGHASTEIVVNNTTGLAFSQYPDGAFTIQQFNPITAAAIGSPIVDSASFTGLQYIGGTLYGTAILTGGGASTLRTLNPLTGTSTTIGATGVGPIAGLAYNGTLYGIGGGGGPAGLYTINISTGVATLIGSTGIQAGSLAFGPDGNLYAGGTGPNQGKIYRVNPSTAASTLVGSTGIGSDPGVTGLALFSPGGLTTTPAPPTFALALVALLAMSLYFAVRRRLSSSSSVTR